MIRSKVIIQSQVTLIQIHVPINSTKAIYYSIKTL